MFNIAIDDFLNIDFRASVFYYTLFNTYKFFKQSVNC